MGEPIKWPTSLELSVEQDRQVLLLLYTTAN